MLRAEVGETFAVPFFLFPEGCQKFLRSGYERWLTARANREKASQQELQKQRQAELLLRAKAADYLRNRNMAALVELSMVQSGIFDEWQVLLTPNRGTGGAPITVIVPARNSRSARLQAVSIYPNYTATIARVLNR